MDANTRAQNPATFPAKFAAARVQGTQEIRAGEIQRHLHTGARNVFRGEKRPGKPAFDYIIRFDIELSSDPTPIAAQPAFGENGVANGTTHGTIALNLQPYWQVALLDPINDDVSRAFPRSDHGRCDYAFSRNHGHSCQQRQSREV